MQEFDTSVFFVDNFINIVLVPLKGSDTMFPRYGRSHRKYKVRQPTPTHSYGEKLKARTIVSAVILVILIVMSFFKFTPSGRIKKYLYTSYNLKNWQEAFMPAFKKAGAFSEKTVAVYADVFNLKKEEKDSSVSRQPVAKAQAHTVLEMCGPPEIKKEAERWIMPHPGEISSVYGERVHPVTGEVNTHNGIDIAASYGENVCTVHSGTVEKTGTDNVNGNYIIVNHGEGITSVYIHLSVICVNPGQMLQPGEKIGEVGSTGVSTGPHLHFEIKENGVSVNPEKYIYPDKG